MPVFDMINFNELANFKVKAGIKYSHSIKRGLLTPHFKTWICKEIEDKSQARREALAQEFFRIIIPHQPETRIACDYTTQQYFILSEEVKGYCELPIKKAECFENGTYTGLGQVLVGSLFLQEIDLKNGNVGLNEQGQVIKIDGDWCFAEDDPDFLTKKYNITQQSIENLPYPFDYYAYNWLDLIKDNVKNGQSSQIVNPGLSNAPVFRAEVNQALLKICLIPDCFIDAFVTAFMPTQEGQRFVTLIKSRRDELQQSALQNESFNDYLKSAPARLDADNLLIHLMAFQVGEQQVITVAQQSALAISFGARRDLVIIPDSTSLGLSVGFSDAFNACHQLIRKLELNLSYNDIQLKDFINNTKDHMQTATTDELMKLKTNLTQIYNSVASDEVKAIKNSIRTFRQNAGFFSVGMKEKANKIEQALYATPLRERQTLISDSQSNKVQKALASHRYFFGMLRLTSSGEIDMTKAANSFKELKKQFSQHMGKEASISKFTSAKF